MIGLPVDEEALRERFWGEPKPRGPKPILPTPAETRRRADVEDTGAGAPGWRSSGNRVRTTALRAGPRRLRTGDSRAAAPPTAPASSPPESS